MRLIFVAFLIGFSFSAFTCNGNACTEGSTWAQIASSTSHTYPMDIAQFSYINFILPNNDNGDVTWKYDSTSNAGFVLVSYGYDYKVVGTNPVKDKSTFAFYISIANGGNVILKTSDGLVTYTITFTVTTSP